jgi:menaquinone-dependent protoporphyrinogen IX oxidase
MTIQYLHASKFGNGAAVAAKFKRQMAVKGIAVEVQHIRDATPNALAPADLYVFSSPARMGRPIRGMRRFLKKVQLPAGTRYALLTTEMAPKPDKKTGRMPTEEELARWQRVRPLMNDVLQGKGLVHVAEDKVHVTGLKGPLEDRWEEKVGAFASQIALAVAERPQDASTRSATRSRHGTTEQETGSARIR